MKVWCLQIQEIKGRLFCWYKVMGILKFQEFTYATKGNRLFTLNPDVDLEVNPRYSDRMNKPESRKARNRLLI